MQSTKYLSTLKQINRRMAHAPKGERIMSSLYPYRGSGYGWWGQNMAEQVQHFKNWTYVAVNIICSKIGSMSPNLAYVGDQPVPGRTVKACQRGFYNVLGRGFGGSGEVSAVQGGYFPGANLFSDSGQTYLTIGEYRSKSLSVIKPHEELEPLENWHPLRRLLENPNSVDTMFDLLYESQLFQELCGVSYIWVVPNEYGVPCELWVIPSHWVWPKTGGGRAVQEPYYDERERDDSDYLHPIRGSEQLISHYEVRPWGGMGPAGALYLPADQVIMERWKNPMDKINGYGTLSAIAQWIDLEESISKSRWAQMMNQARPELWIELGEGYEDPDSDRLDRMYAQLGTRIQGEFNVGRPFVTPPGAKVTPLSFNPTEMAYFASEEQVRDMILSAKGVPKSAAGVSQDMTFGSVLATLATFCENGINPRLTMRGQSLSKHLASRYDEKQSAWSSLTGKGYGGASQTRRVRAWWDNCVPADPAQVNSDLQTDATFYGLTPNELRALRGRAPYKLGGNNPIVNGPAGPMPLPINEEEKMDDLGALVQQYTEQATSKKDVDKLSTDAVQDEEGDEGEPLALEDHSGDEGPQDRLTEPVDMDPQIEEPNGKPSKAFSKSSARRPIGELTREAKQKFPSTHYQCQEFAEYVIALLRKQGETGRMVGNTFHAVVAYGGKYYDADAPDGVSNWRTLPFFQRNPGKLEADYEEDALEHSVIKDWSLVTKGRLDDAAEGLLWLGGNQKWTMEELNPTIRALVNHLYKRGFVKRESDGSFRISQSGSTLKHILRQALADMGMKNDKDWSSNDDGGLPPGANSGDEEYVVKGDVGSAASTIQRIGDGGFKTMEYADIERDIRQALTGLTIADIKQVYAALSMTAMPGHGKGKLIDTMVQRIKELKGSWERTQFRAEKSLDRPRNRLRTPKQKQTKPRNRLKANPSTDIGWLVEIWKNGIREAAINIKASSKKEAIMLAKERNSQYLGSEYGWTARKK